MICCRVVYSSRGAFTLVELLFVLFLAGVLLTLAGPALLSAVDQSDYISCESRLEMLRRAKSSYVVDHPGGGSPTNTVDQTVFRNYLPQGFTFTCPRDSSSDYTSIYDVYSISLCPYCSTNIPLGARDREVIP
jgi:prepilin-type N-terminal cleavage/methylation domain-containing protein